MRSKLAEELKREQREEVAALTAAERVALARRLGEEALAMIMAAHHLDRHSAIREMRRSHQMGRKRSAVLEALDADS